MKTHILVTGATGQLGKTIESLYHVNNYNWVFIFISKKELDITSPIAIARLFDKHSFQYCINCAAYTNVEGAEKDPEAAFEVNATGAKNLAWQCRKSGTILIHISTDYVFDGEKSTPYTIDDATNPINQYGLSKLEGEKNVQDILDNFYIIRTSWLYSKKYGKNFYRFILDQAHQGNNISITTDQVGCPTDTEDLANYIIEVIILKKPRFGIYHFCGSDSKTWYEFANQILKENHLEKKIELAPVDYYKTLAKRPKYSVLAI